MTRPGQSTQSGNSWRSRTSGPVSGNSDPTYSSNGGVYATLHGNYFGDEGELLAHRYEFWVDRSERGDGSPISPPPIMYEIDAEIARLRSILEEHQVDPGSRKIIVRRPRHIPDSPAAERLLRYEASLERAFERT